MRIIRTDTETQDKGTQNRRICLLQIIPRAPAKHDAKQLTERLKALGFEIDLRSVQRDLKMLAERFPVICDARDKPYGWQWAKDTPVKDMPGMDPSTALSFYLTSQYLEPLFPKLALNHLKHYFDLATRVLDEMQDKKVGKWSKKVGIAHKSQNLLPPKQNSDIQELLYQATLEELQINASYLPRSAENAKKYLLNPLGIAVIDNLLYLVTTRAENDDFVMHLPFHRFKKVELTEVAAKKPAGFSLSTYIAENAFGQPRSTKDIKLEMAIHSKTAEEDGQIARVFSETPISKDQVIKEDKTGNQVLQATVRDTNQLRWWILNLGDQVEVKKPQYLRDHFARVTRNMAKHYE